MTLQDAERPPQLMVDVLDQGRVLVDRDADCPGLKTTERAWRQRAEAADSPLEERLPEPDLEAGR
ncbi:MAG: hypothetical protein ACRDL0_23055 [Thermoleophilaceae bacterium]